VLIYEPAGTAGPVSRALRQVFAAGGDGSDVATVASLDFEALSDRDFVVVQGMKSPGSGLGVLLRNFVEQGGSVLYLPEREEDSEIAARFRADWSWGAGEADWVSGEDRWGDMQTEHPLYRGVFAATPAQADLPVFSQVLRRTPNPEEEVIVSTERGVPLLTRISAGQGHAYFMAASLQPEHGNLIRHALFVPTLLRMAELSRSTPVYAGTLGRTTSWSIRGVPSAPNLEIRMVPADTAQATLLPEVRNLPGSLLLGLGSNRPHAGHYAVLAGPDTLALIGMNHDRRESDASPYDIPEWEAKLDSAGWERAEVWDTDATAIAARVNQLEKGTPWWKWFLLLALAALLTETLLLSRWKRPSSSAA
jgi:hypothetical protein